MLNSPASRFLSEGVAQLEAGRARDACSLFARARQADPRMPEAAFCHATALIACEDYPAAEAGLRDAVKLRPTYAEAWERLSLLLQKQGRFKDALACHDVLARLQPKAPKTWVSYGRCLFELDRLDAALRCHERALALDPSCADAHLGRATSLHKLERMTEAVEAYQRYLAHNKGNAKAWSQCLMAMNHLPSFGPEKLWQAHHAFGKSFEVSTPRRFERDKNPDRRLRVGFLSPDLKAHSVAYFFEPLLRHLDKQAFEVFLYHDGDELDSVSRRLEAEAFLWRNVSRIGSEQLEAILLGDTLDILVDLAGHAGANRLPLFARRLAPVQLSYLGYPNTTGLAEMDYRFVDVITDPDENDQRYHSERLVRFSPCAWTYEPLLEAPEPLSGKTHGEGGTVYGSFNYLGKVTDEVLGLWKAILDRDPASRLLLKSPDLSSPDIRQSVLRRLQTCGLGPERVELLDRTASRQSHLSQYNRVDVALDPFPYNGTTTTCEALYMGVPVVTLGGDRHAARVGKSLLTAIGHPDWVARNRDEYLDLALRLAAQSRVASASDRLLLRKRVQESQLMNAPAQSALFGQALRSCWQGFCSG
jgi:predicted O-linked N-acetylglucosamine transferase (SPINDLY family)